MKYSLKLFYAIRGKEKHWFCLFLLNRKQYESISVSFLDIEVVLCSVPQGTVLDSLLFLLYINYLRDICKDCIAHYFADDKNLFYANKEK